MVSSEKTVAQNGMAGELSLLEYTRQKLWNSTLHLNPKITLKGRKTIAMVVGAGKIQLTPQHQGERVLFPGKNITVPEAPFTARLSLRPNLYEENICTGTVIARAAILTAAACGLKVEKGKYELTFENRLSFAVAGVAAYADDPDAHTRHYFDYVQFYTNLDSKTHKPAPTGKLAIVFTKTALVNELVAPVAFGNPDIFKMDDLLMVPAFSNLFEDGTYYDDVINKKPYLQLGIFKSMKIEHCSSDVSNSHKKICMEPTVRSYKWKGELGAPLIVAGHLVGVQATAPTDGTTEGLLFDQNAFAWIQRLIKPRLYKSEVDDCTALIATYRADFTNQLVRHWDLAETNWDMITCRELNEIQGGHELAYENSLSFATVGVVIYDDAQARHYFDYVQFHTEYDPVRQQYYPSGQLAMVFTKSAMENEMVSPVALGDSSTFEIGELVAVAGFSGMYEDGTFSYTARPPSAYLQSGVFKTWPYSHCFTDSVTSHNRTCMERGIHSYMWKGELGAPLIAFGHMIGLQMSVEEDKSKALLLEGESLEWIRKLTKPKVITGNPSNCTALIAAYRGRNTTTTSKLIRHWDLSENTWDILICLQKKAKRKLFGEVTPATPPIAPDLVGMFVVVRATFKIEVHTCILIRSNAVITTAYSLYGEQVRILDIIQKRSFVSLDDSVNHLKELLVHPGYEFDSSTNNVAVLRLERNFHSREYLNVMALPELISTAPAAARPRQVLDVWGWGKVFDYYDRPLWYSYKPQSLTSKHFFIDPPENCVSNLELVMDKDGALTYILPDNEICLRALDPDSDNLYATDTGGAAMRISDYKLVGFVTLANDKFGRVVKLAPYIDWLASVL